MDKREFLRLLFAGGASVLLGKSRDGPQSTGILPSPRINGFSVESVINSRVSDHAGYGGPLSDQVLANVLWAAAKAPLLGSSRTIYAALPDNVYRYDPSRHRLTVHTAGNRISQSSLAFEVGVAGDLVVDAGMSLHYAQLAAVTFWSTTGNRPGCCPKSTAWNHANAAWNPSSFIHMVNSYGRLRAVTGITRQRAAVPSDGILPPPATTGSMTFEKALARLDHGRSFRGEALTVRQLAQVAWASYGCVPHLTYDNKVALTVASWAARYYLTGRVYVVHSTGVYRYRNRLPSGANNTADHRIELVAVGDRRAGLRQSVARLPTAAPVYFVYCGDSSHWDRHIEAGYCGASALLQATSLGLRGHLTARLTSAERAATVGALALGSGDVPLLVLSLGHPDPTLHC